MNFAVIDAGLVVKLLLLLLIGARHHTGGLSTGRGISSLWGVQFSPLGGDGDLPFDPSYTNPQ